MEKPYIITCKKCGKEFKWHTRKKKYHYKCSSSYKKENKRKRYTAKFVNMKSFIRLRDDYTCKECGKNVKNNDVTKREAPIHHIDGNPKNNDSKNLVTLCVGCHLKIHRRKLKKFNVNKITIPKDKPFAKKIKKQLFKNIN